MFYTNTMTGLVSWAASMADSHRRKKALKKINKRNELQKGISKYYPSNIEFFFDSQERIGSMMFSGGAPDLRVRAAARAAECAFLQGDTVLVLHCNNTELENRLVGCLGSGDVCLINKNRPLYDPFTGASNNEINKLILSAAESGYRIGQNGRYYINGISDFIREKGISPYCDMYITCPHSDLIDRINDAESKGIITSDSAQKIIAQILQGESERGKIEGFFSELSNQGSNVLASRNNKNRSVSLKTVANHHQLLSIDLMSGTNTVLLDLILSETELLVSQGKRLLIILDNISPLSSEIIKKYIRVGGNCSVFALSDDIYASCGGEEKELYALAGIASKIIVSRHSSSYSCQKISDILGYYDKQEVSNSYAGNINYFGRWGFGSAKVTNVTTKRENIVKPEEIQKMSDHEVYILSKKTGELAFSPIV